jgi:DNA replication protein DnaT
MPRIRTIKPTFWSDEAVANLTRDARLLALGLISFADDEGRFLASPAAIAGYIYPHDVVPPARVRRWLAEVQSTGIVLLYTANGLEYGMFPNYRKHQRISHPQPSTFPHPNGQIH